MNKVFKKVFIVIAVTIMALFVIQITAHADDFLEDEGFIVDPGTTYEDYSAVEAEEAARIAADQTEKDAREAADLAEKTAREAADQAEEQARKAAIENEAQARILALETEAALREEQIAKLEKKNLTTTLILGIISGVSLMGVVILFIIKR